MKKVVILILAYVMFWFLAWCKNNLSISKSYTELNFIWIENQNIFYKKNTNVFINKNVIITWNDYKAWAFDDIKSTLKFLDKKGNYVIVETQEEKKIWSKKLITSFGTFEANFSRFEWDKFANYYLYGNNLAYYKCEKLIYFSDSNTNDCLANQILVNDKVVDQIDMNFFDKNRKYLFAIRYLDNEKMIYVKGDKYYIYNIKTDKKDEFIELNQIRNYAMNNALKKHYIAEEDVESSLYFDFIWFDKEGKLITTQENFWNMYDDIIIQKTKERMRADGINPEDYIFPDNDYLIRDFNSLENRIQRPNLYYNDKSSIIIPPYIIINGLNKLSKGNIDGLLDIYIDWKLYTSNTISPKIVNWDIIYALYRNLNFEQDNSNYFDSSEKTIVQSMYGETQSYLQFNIYKNKQVLTSIDYRSDSSIIPSIIFKDIDNNFCRMTINDASINIEICVEGNNVLAKTYYPNKELTWLNEEIIIYNDVKLDFGNYLISGMVDLYDKDLVAISPYKLYNQFWFDSNWLNWLFFISPKITDQIIKDLKLMNSLSELKDDDEQGRELLVKKLSQRIDVKKELLISLLFWNTDEEHTPEQKDAMSKLENFFNELNTNNNLYFTSYDPQNISFYNHKLVIENLNELLGIY